jgi:hypothetical protein
MPSIEDLLISEYNNNFSGEIYKEIPVGQIENKNRQRRIDAVLIKNNNNKIHQQGEYNLEEFKQKAKNKKIHLIEAKRKLGRAVIGQIEVGMHLFNIDFETKEIQGVALCSKTNIDIKKYCDLKNIEVVIYPKDKLYSNKNNNKASKNKSNSKNNSRGTTEIEDIRNEPDKLRFGSFKRGWNDALDGKLYDTIKEKKTHSNIGNLFGWIYGDCSDEMKEKIWNQYIENTF